LIFAAMLNGLGAGILWCALGEYISESATDKSKGHMNGLFWFWLSAKVVARVPQK
jgi:hypothetical protein